MDSGVTATCFVMKDKVMINENRRRLLRPLITGQSCFLQDPADVPPEHQ